MKALYRGVQFRCIAAIAMTFLLMNAMDTDAQQGNDEEKTFPLVVNQNESDSLPNGYHYEMWKQNPGTVQMTVYNDDAKFRVEWSNIQNFVARIGLKYDETQTHDEIGTFTADVAFQKSGIQGDGLAYYGIYGWTVDPLVEFYVMEDWENWRPHAGDGNHNSKGTINVDGSQYDVITRQMHNQPSVKGDASFPQIFSIRQNTRSSGSISISEHFKEWERLGVSLGKLYEVKIKVESYSGSNGSNGSCNVTQGVIKVNGEIPTAVRPSRGTIARKHPIFFDNNGTRGVYSLISLTGAKIRSMTFDPSKPVDFSTNDVAPGLYYLQFKGNNITPVTRPMLVK
ncbi:MAG TPA: glycoside hydrolase family 11 protein [Chitinispirillaceae bacterium]|nr:glycoside hydrolase family 11 protein [Chitinispirillaceae bacterium]